MKTIIHTVAMNTLLATTLSAQTTNWLGAYEQAFGHTGQAGWMLDMTTDGYEVHVSNNALVLVDREPIVSTPDARAFLRAGVFGLAGTRLNLCSEIDIVNDSVLHGTYTGTLEGMPVVMDQYVKERNGVPVAVVRVIREMHGSAVMLPYANTAFVLRLMGKEEPSSERLLTRR